MPYQRLSHSLSYSLSFFPFFPHPPSQSPSARYHFRRFLVAGLSTARGLALAFQAGSPNVSEFSLAILRLNEQGFLEKLTRKWWDNINNCPVEQTTSMYTSINLFKLES